MNKIGLIIKREYLTRVRKRSFIIMSILGPLLFAALMIVPALLATMEDKEVKTIAVIDETNILTSYNADGSKSFVLNDKEYLKFKMLQDVDLETLQKNFESTGYYAVLYIPSNIISTEKAVLYSDKQPSLDVSSYISSGLEEEIRNMKLVAHNIKNLDEILKDVETDVRISNILWTKDGESKKSSTELFMGIGYASGLLIYMFIFMYGAMVMRGVIEEKVSRIVEVIVSSVRPFQLMMGKIVGVGLVGLTQFLLWIILTLVLVTGASTFIGKDSSAAPHQQANGTELFTDQAATVSSDIAPASDEDFLGGVFEAMDSINIVGILAAFMFYFLFGYLLYGSLFAVVGAAVDNETETQQFMLPITIPLILGIVVMANVITNPHGSLAFWFSMFPLTSPVVMMVRMPFEVPLWEILVSGAILLLTILGTVWVAAKIYRTGILMYGKKVNYKELWKWLKYKN